MSVLSRTRTAIAAARSSSLWVWGLPNLVLGAFVVALFVLLVVIHRRENEIRHQALAQDVQWAEQTIRKHFAENEEFLQRLAREIVEDSIDGEAFHALASRHVAANPELVHVVWVDADQVVRWAAPVETATWNAGERLSDVEQSLAFQRAQRTTLPAYGLPLPAPDDRATIELYVPVIDARRSLGAVMAVYAADELLQLAPPSFLEKYRVVLETEDRVLGANSGVEVASDVTGTVRLDPPGNGVRLRVTAYTTQSRVPLDMLVLLAAGLVLLMAWSLWALTAHTRRRRRAERERDRLFNLSLDMLCVAHLDGRIVRANPAFEAVLGLAPADLRGATLIDLVHPDDLAATRAEVEKLARGEPSTHFENRCRRSDGVYRWLVWSVNPAVEEKLLYCVAHDITDRKRAEDTVRREYAFRNAMEESVMTGLRAVDLEGRIIYVNHAFCAMVGFSADELLGRVPPFPYWPEENLATLSEVTNRWMHGDAPRSGFEIRICRKSGERFYARMYISPLIDADGRQTGWMGSMVDITEQKRARTELEASHERFVAVLEGLDAAVYVADVATDEILFANRAFKAIHGDDAVGRRCGEIAGARLDDADASRVDVRRLGPEDLPREICDGEVLNERTRQWLHVRERAIRWVDGRVVRMQIATDITDRKRAEEVSLQQQERLHHTSRLITMGEMASSLAHELNQPLSAIANYCMGSVNRLKSETFRREDLLGAMEKAATQAERAGKIIRRMRDFVNKREPNRAVVQVAEVAEDAIGFAEIEARKARLAIRVDIPPDLPPVYVDRIMIEQVLLNLVKNGIEAMAQARTGRELVVSARLKDGAVEVAVADQGPGIPAAEAEKLFEPFFTTKPEGMGMGLSICRSIVEYHDGRLWVQDNPAGGTILCFTLPVAAALERTA